MTEYPGVFIMDGGVLLLVWLVVLLDWLVRRKEQRSRGVTAMLIESSWGTPAIARAVDAPDTAGGNQRNLVRAERVPVASIICSALRPSSGSP